MIDPIDEIVDRYSVHQPRGYPKGTIARKGLKKRLHKAIQKIVDEAVAKERGKHDKTHQPEL